MVESLGILQVLLQLQPQPRLTVTVLSFSFLLLEEDIVEREWTRDSCCYEKIDFLQHLFNGLEIVVMR